MKSILHVSFLIFVFSLSQAYPQTPSGDVLPPRHHPPDREFHMVNIDLRFKFDMEKKEVFGTAVEKIVPLRTDYDTVNLDAVDMTIDKIVMDGKSLNFAYDGNTLSIALGGKYGIDDTLIYTITYSTFPKKGIFFIEPDSAYPKRSPQVWSQSEMEDARYWFPCHDYPDDFLTSSLTATVPEDWVVVSNGTLDRESTDHADKTKTFKWVETEPHVIYLISIVAGKYSVAEDHFGNDPIYYYVPPAQASYSMDNFSHTPDILKFYSDITGYHYPWQKLALAAVSDFTFGGMENVSAITLTDGTLHDKDAEPQVESTNLVAHETAHQWFGDLLTCRSWSNAWLNEGFATYFEALYARPAFGEDYFQYEMSNDQREVISADERERRPTVYDRYNDPVDLFSVYIYPRGADILNMLRGILGDQLFTNAIRHYVNEFQHRNVDTHDFENAVREATGYNLYWFFNEWVYKAGHPVYDVSYDYDQSSHKLDLHVTQAQIIDSLTPLYKMPVDIYIVTASQKITARIWVDSVSNNYTFDVTDKPLMVNFDENNYLLKVLNFSKSIPELAYQLANDPNVAGRIWAAEELGTAKGDSAVSPLLEALSKDDFWGVREACVRSLGHFHMPDVEQAFGNAVDDKDPRVQEQAIDGLAAFKDKDLVDLFSRIYSSRKNYFVRAAAVRALSATDPDKALPIVENALTQDSYEEVLQSTALTSLASIDSAKAFDEAVKLAHYGEPQSLRLRAINEIGRIGPHDANTMSILESYINDPYIWARLVSISSLGRIGDKSVLTVLQDREKVEIDGRLKDAARRAIDSISRREK